MQIKTTFHGHFPHSDLNWTAIDEDTYDGAPDSTSPMGWGATEEEAIADLKQKIAEREDEC